MTNITIGTPFFHSEKGKYRFFYPNWDNKSTTAKEDTNAEAVPTGVRCIKSCENKTPVLVSEEFARNHSLQYRIIWIEDIDG